MKVLVLLLVTLLLVVPSFSRQECRATRGKYRDEDSTQYFADHAIDKEILQTKGYEGNSYGYNPELAQAQENNLFTFNVKRNSMSEGFLFYYDSTMIFKPNIYFYIKKDKIYVSIEPIYKSYKQMEVEIDGNFDIDNEFVQFALFLTKDKATLYINGVEKASVEYYIKNFRGFFQDNTYYLAQQKQGNQFDGYVKDILLATDVDLVQKACLLNGKRLYKEGLPIQKDNFVQEVELSFLDETFTKQCMAVRGKYHDEDATRQFVSHAMRNKFYDGEESKSVVYAHKDNGWNYGYWPELGLANENTLFTYRVKRVNKSTGIMFFYNSFMQFQHNLYFSILEDSISVVFNDEYGKYIFLTAQMDGSFDIDNEFVQLSVFVTYTKATLYINGVEKASLEGEFKGFRDYFYDQSYYMTYRDGDKVFDGYVQDILLAYDVDVVQQQCLLQGKRLYQDWLPMQRGDKIEYVEDSQVIAFIDELNNAEIKGFQQQVRQFIKLTVEQLQN